MSNTILNGQTKNGDKYIQIPQDWSVHYYALTDWMIENKIEFHMDKLHLKLSNMKKKIQKEKNEAIFKSSSFLDTFFS